MWQAIKWITYALGVIFAIASVLVFVELGAVGVPISIRLVLSGICVFVGIGCVVLVDEVD